MSSRRKCSSALSAIARYSRLRTPDVTAAFNAPKQYQLIRAELQSTLACFSIRVAFPGLSRPPQRLQRLLNVLRASSFDGLPRRRSFRFLLPQPKKRRPSVQSATLRSSIGEIMPQILAAGFVLIEGMAVTASAKPVALPTPYRHAAFAVQVCCRAEACLASAIKNVLGLGLASSR